MGKTKYVFNQDGTELDLSYRGLQYVVVKAPVNIKRKWTGNLNDSTESSYGDWDEQSNSVGSGVPIRLQDRSGKNEGYADKAASSGTNKYIRTKMTAYGWSGATWEYEAVRK